jgi:hypothetical protein
MPPDDTDFLPLAQAMTDPFFFTVWPSRRAARDGVTRRSVEKFVATLSEKSSEVVPAKDTLPMFGGFLTQNNHRLGEKLSSVIAFGFDCDRGESPDSLLQELSSRRMNYVFYKTYSHSFVCEHNPQGLQAWRVIFPLSRWLRAPAPGEPPAGLRERGHRPAPRAGLGGHRRRGHPACDGPCPGPHPAADRFLIQMSNANRMSLVRHDGIEWRRLQGPICTGSGFTTCGTRSHPNWSWRASR